MWIGEIEYVGKEERGKVVRMGILYHILCTTWRKKAAPYTTRSCQVWPDCFWTWKIWVMGLHGKYIKIYPCPILKDNLLGITVSHGSKFIVRKIIFFHSAIFLHNMGGWKASLYISLCAVGLLVYIHTFLGVLHDHEWMWHNCYMSTLRPCSFLLDFLPSQQTEFS